MKKILQILSCFLLLLNPGCGLMIVASIGYSYRTDSYWWILIILLTIPIVWCTLTFHFYMYREENKKRHIAYLKWKAEYSKTHDLIDSGNDEYGDYCEIWRNKKAGKLIEY